MVYLRSNQKEKTGSSPSFLNNNHFPPKGKKMSTPLYNTEPIKIAVTKNYDKFRFDSTNRSPDEKKVQELIEDIKSNNLLHLFPIIVSPDFSIFDGQHRTLAAQELGVPLYYIISEDMKIEDVPFVTARVTQWKLSDHLKHYRVRQFPEYLKLQSFMDRYPFLSVNVAMFLTCNSPGGANHALADKFRHGKYEATSIPFASKVANAALDFKDSDVDFYNQRAFLMSLAKLFLDKRYDHSRMQEKLKYLSRKVVKCPDMDTYLEMFTEIYNHKTRTENRVVFSR